jgi:hypothetical protein
MHNRCGMVAFGLHRADPTPGRRKLTPREAHRLPDRPGTNHGWQWSFAKWTDAARTTLHLNPSAQRDKVRPGRDVCGIVGEETVTGELIVDQWSNVAAEALWRRLSEIWIRTLRGGGGFNGA